MSKNQRLNASITIGAVLEGSVRKNIGILKSGLSSIGSAIKDVERRQRELAKQRSVLEKEGRSVEDLDREYKDLERTLARLKRAQERWTAAAMASRRVGSTFSAMAADIGRQARRMAIGVGAAGAAIFGLASSTAALGDNVAKTADKLGIGIEELQELRYAAERSGIATDSFDTALEKMVKNLGEAATGTGAAKDALGQLGLSAGDLVAMSPEAALAVIADRMGEVGTQAERAAIANDIFGRSGVGMLNMLRDGSRGLAVLREDARRTGYVLSEEAARDAEVFQDTLLDLQLIGKGLKNTIGAELMPVVTRTMRSISDWLSGHRPLVQKWAKAFAEAAENALPAIGAVAEGIGRIGALVLNAITWTADFVGGWENFGMVVGAALASGTLIKIGKFVVALVGLGRAMVGLVGTLPMVAGGVKAIGAAMVANPIGLVIASIAAGAFLIWKNWEPIKEWFADLWGDVRATFSGFSNFVGSVFRGDMGAATDGVEKAWQGMSAAVGKWFWVMAYPIRRIFDGVVKPVMDMLGLTEPIGAAWEEASAAVGGAMEWVGEKFTTAWELVKPVIDGLHVGVDIGEAWEAVKQKLGPVLDWLGERFSWLSNIVSPVIDGLRWVRDKGAAAASAVGLGGGATPQGASGGWVQERAIGGHFGPGMVLRHEKGAELTYENRAGWVADARSTRRLAAYADKIAGVMRAGMASPAAAMAPASTHSHYYTVNASGTSAEDLIALLDRRARLASQAGLYDRVPGTGPWGR